MRVAGEHDGVRRRSLDQPVDDLLALRDVAVPAVGAGGEAARRRSDGAVERREAGLLRQHVPARLRRREALQQPLALLGAEHRASGVQVVHAVPRRVALGVGACQGLIGAVLATVEDVEHGLGAPAEAAVEREIWSLGLAGASERHVLPVRAIRGSAAGADLLDGDRPDRHLLVGVVVLELVVVPRHEPRVCGVRGLEVLVGLVLAVADAVLVERADLDRRAVGPHVPHPALVDVVAEVDDGVDVRCRRRPRTA